jgi:uncharacterized protein YcfJ
MKNSILLAVVGGTLAAIASAQPTPSTQSPQTMYGDVARVLSATPVTERRSAPPADCPAERIPTGYRTAQEGAPAPCEPAPDSRERIVAYDVRYQYNGHEFRTRMPYDPGPEMPVNVEVRPPAANVSIGPRRPQYRGTY